VHKGNIWTVKSNKLIIFKFRYLISSWPSFRRKKHIQQLSVCHSLTWILNSLGSFNRTLLRGKGLKNLKTLTVFFKVGNQREKRDPINISTKKS